ncbi:MAG: hypothetical protein R3B59_07600 [Dehalococcoidia bacterium]
MVTSFDAGAGGLDGRAGNKKPRRSGAGGGVRPREGRLAAAGYYYEVGMHVASMVGGLGGAGNGAGIGELLLELWVGVGVVTFGVKSFKWLMT